MFGWTVGKELAELLTKPLTGTKAVNNTKITHFSQYLSIDTAIFLYFETWNDGEFTIFGYRVGEELAQLLMKPLTGTKAVDNTKITHFSQYLSIDTAIFLYFETWHLSTGRWQW
jgi:TM2 domain-containing membrane protein YozV